MARLAYVFIAMTVTLLVTLMRSAPRGEVRVFRDGSREAAFRETQAQLLAGAPTGPGNAPGVGGQGAAAALGGDARGAGQPGGAGESGGDEGKGASSKPAEDANPELKPAEGAPGGVSADSGLMVDLFRTKQQPGECGAKVAPDQPRWPLYKVSEFDPPANPQPEPKSNTPLMPHKSYRWGQDRDPKFEGAKFFLYDTGVFDTRPAEACFSRRHNLPPPNTTGWFDNLDSAMSIVNREYFPDIQLIKAFREHKQRTLDPEEASIFVIPYSPALMVHSHPCEEMRQYFKEEEARNVSYSVAWDIAIARELKQSKHFQRRGGKDHIHTVTWYKGSPGDEYRALLQGGPTVLSVERYIAPLVGQLPEAYANDRVVIIPYVSSTFTDAAQFPDIKPQAQYNASKWWFFRGNMHRRGQGLAREHLPELGSYLGGVDFADARPNTKNARTPLRWMVEQTDKAMRQVPICMVPEGDSPTSLRLFEALAVGCLPVVMGDKAHMRHDVPFPNLINWDRIAIFADGLVDVAACKTGLREMADTLNAVLGPGISEPMAAKVREMRAEGAQVFREYLSYWRNPDGVASAIFYESWFAQQSH